MPNALLRFEIKTSILVPSIGGLEASNAVENEIRETLERLADDREDLIAFELLFSGKPKDVLTVSDRVSEQLELPMKSEPAREMPLEEEAA